MFIAPARNNEAKLRRSDMFAASPPDVREVFDLPMSPSFDLSGAPPRSWGTAPRTILAVPEGHRPSAHQAAEPQTFGSYRS
jgi:hypothetical protein